MRKLLESSPGDVLVISNGVNSKEMVVSRVDGVSVTFTESVPKWAERGCVIRPKEVDVRAPFLI